jgi:hypothetical protein
MNKPIYKQSAGPIDLAIWQNTIETPRGKATVLKAQVERRFKSASGEYRSTSSFSITDLPKVLYLLTQAYDYIIRHEQAEREQRRLEQRGDGHD